MKWFYYKSPELEYELINCSVLRMFSILQKYVFPRLERYWQSNNAKFQAVDLRWGINEKTQLNQKTLVTCLNEVARCQKISPKPNFLILLGDKYGWQPIPEKIPTTEWDEIKSGKLIKCYSCGFVYDRKNTVVRGVVVPTIIFIIVDNSKQDS